MARFVITGGSGVGKTSVLPLPEPRYGIAAEPQERRDPPKRALHPAIEVAGGCLTASAKSPFRAGREPSVVKGSMSRPRARHNP